MNVNVARKGFLFKALRPFKLNSTLIVLEPGEKPKKQM
jgi:hypothetical protein